MKRSTIVLAGVLLVLVIATVLVLRGPGEQSATASTGEMLAQYDSAQVDRLVIVSRGSAITLEREPHGWMITSPVRHRADRASVDTAIARGRRIELKGMVSANPAKQRVYQVDSTGTSVRVYAQGVEKAAFWIGKAGLQFTEAYVRREGSNEVYEAEGPLSWIFAKSLSEWRDRGIFRAERSSIKEVAYGYRDTTFTLKLRDSVWVVDGARASGPVVEGVLSSLANYLANEFVDSTVVPAGPPSAIVELLGTQIRFYRGKGSPKYLVQTSRDPQWFSVEGWRADEILKRKKEFLVP
jgi:hypothetical protein